VIDDEVPKSFASVIGHVCGVIAVGMTASTLFGIWALARKPTVAGFFFVSTAVALALLMYRWAGALTGFWDTRGRLAVPKIVYSIMGALFVASGVLWVGVSVARPPANLDAGLVAVAGVASSLSISYLCYLAYHRFK
jgi:hypothetical protein